MLTSNACCELIYSHFCPQLMVCCPSGQPGQSVPSLVQVGQSHAIGLVIILLKGQKEKTAMVHLRIHRIVIPKNVQVRRFLTNKLYLLAIDCFEVVLHSDLKWNELDRLHLVSLYEVIRKM